MIKPRAMILTGDGLNCAAETARAFTLAGAQSTIVHINDWLARPRLLLDYQLLGLPGGFSFADYLGAGQVMALKIRYGAYAELCEFIESGKGVIGICNGLQILLRLALLPGTSQTPRITLAHNQPRGFIDIWVAVRSDAASTCWWTRDLEHEEFTLPIRHGEGRFVFAASEEMADLAVRGQIALRYIRDCNGSAGLIAGISNPRGNVLGLMPHPEAAIISGSSPWRRGGDNLGLTIFRKGVERIRAS